MISGTQVLDFRGRPGERVDSMLTRWDMARFEAESVGWQMANFPTLATILLRACRINAQQLSQLLQPNGGRLPQDQVQYDAMITGIRQMGHILERSPDNIMNGLHAQGSTQTTYFGQTSDTFNPDTGNSDEQQYTYMMNGSTIFGNGQSSGSQGYDNYYYSGKHGDVHSREHGDVHSQSIFHTGQGTEEYDSGTDSDTASSCGDRQYDFSHLAHLPDDEKQQVLFANMENSKGMWRQYMRKPVRKVRRFFRKHFSRKGKGRGKGRGKGKRLSGKGITLYCQDMDDQEYEEVLFGGRGRGKGRGKRKGVRSSGKGSGRKGNPRGKDGQIMKLPWPQSNMPEHRPLDPRLPP